MAEEHQSQRSKQEKSQNSQSSDDWYSNQLDRSHTAQTNSTLGHIGSQQPYPTTSLEDLEYASTLIYASTKGAIQPNDGTSASNGHETKLQNENPTVQVFQQLQTAGINLTRSQPKSIEVQKRLTQEHNRLDLNQDHGVIFGTISTSHSSRQSHTATSTAHSIPQMNGWQNSPSDVYTTAASNTPSAPAPAIQVMQGTAESSRQQYYASLVADSPRRLSSSYPQQHVHYDESELPGHQVAALQWSESPVTALTVDPSHLQNSYHEYKKEVLTAEANSSRLVAPNATQATAHTADQEAAETFIQKIADAAATLGYGVIDRHEELAQISNEASVDKYCESAIDKSQPLITSLVPASAIIDKNLSATTGVHEDETSEPKDSSVLTMEEEMHLMVAKMREYQTKDSKKFYQVWESVKKTHTEQLQRAISNPAMAKETATTERATLKTTVGLERPDMAARASAQGSGTSPKQTIVSIQSESGGQQHSLKPISRPIKNPTSNPGADFAVDPTLLGQPVAITTHSRPSQLAIPAGKPEGHFIWPSQYIPVLSLEGSKVLNSTPANLGKQIFPFQIRSMLELNPSFSELCNMINRLGFTVDRARFGKILHAAVSSASVNPTPNKAFRSQFTMPANVQGNRTSALKQNPGPLSAIGLYGKKRQRMLESGTSQEGIPPQPGQKGGPGSRRECSAPPVRTHNPSDLLAQNMYAPVRPPSKSPTPLHHPQQARIQYLSPYMPPGQSTGIDHVHRSYDELDVIDSTDASIVHNKSTTERLSSLATSPLDPQYNSTYENQQLNYGLNTPGSKIQYQGGQLLASTPRKIPLLPHVLPVPPPLTKDLTARKRTFTELIDLTRGLKLLDDDQPVQKVQRLDDSHLNDHYGGQQRRPTSFNAPPNLQPQITQDAFPATHSLATQSRASTPNLSTAIKNPFEDFDDIVKPINKALALRKPRYNPKTIARDVLVAISRHPTQRGLNAHLGQLINRFTKVDYNSDLHTFRWDIVDPGELALGSVNMPPLNEKVDGASNSATKENDTNMVEVEILADAKLQDMVPPVKKTLRPTRGGFSQRGVGRPRGRPRGPISRSVVPPRPSGLRHTSIMEASVDSSSEMPSDGNLETYTSSAIDGSQTHQGPTTMIANDNILPPRPKARGRPRKYPLEYENTITSSPRGRGRGRPPKPKSIVTDESSGQVIKRGRGRPRKSMVADESRLGKHSGAGERLLPPKYLPFSCEWKDCRAELQNLETLRNHLLTVHNKMDISGGFPCFWAGCGIVEQVRDKASLVVKSTHRFHTFNTFESFKDHVEKVHLSSYAWHMGDGPRRSTLDGNESDTSSYLRDATGQQVTPSVVGQAIEGGSASANNRRRLAEMQRQT